jgi:hypothetical protein
MGLTGWQMTEAVVVTTRGRGVTCTVRVPDETAPGRPAEVAGGAIGSLGSATDDDCSVAATLPAPAVLDPVDSALAEDPLAAGVCFLPPPDSSTPMTAPRPTTAITAIAIESLVPYFRGGWTSGIGGSPCSSADRTYRRDGSDHVLGGGCQAGPCGCSDPGGSSVSSVTARPPRWAVIVALFAGSVKLSAAS